MIKTIENYKQNLHTHTTFCDGKNPAEDVVKKAIEKGFDSIGFSAHAPMSYSEYFNKANMQEYIDEIPEDKALPWDFIDIGVSKKYLLGQRYLAYQGITTKNCREGCNGCGANKLGRCTII